MHEPLANGFAFMIENGRGDKVAVLKARNNNVTAVENQLSAFVDALLDPATDLILVLCGNDRTELGLLVVCTADLHLERLLLEQCNEIIGNALLHANNRQSHAALCR